MRANTLTFKFKTPLMMMILSTHLKLRWYLKSQCQCEQPWLRALSAALN